MVEKTSTIQQERCLLRQRDRLRRSKGVWQMLRTANDVLSLQCVIVAHKHVRQTRGRQMGHKRREGIKILMRLVAQAP